MNRILLLARHIQNKIDDNTPSAQEFLQFRNEIIRSNCTDLKDDLELECDLIQKQDELKQRLDKVKEDHTNGNKNEFVTLNAKIHVTDKEIKESTRCLNRRFLEHIVVQENLDKILTDVAWIKNRLEADEIRNYIDNKGVSHTETIIELKNRTKEKEKVLISDIESLKERTKQVKANEILCNSVHEEACRSPAELLVLKDGRSPNIIKRHTERQLQLDHTKEKYQSERENVQREISLLRKELDRECDDHQKLMIQLNMEKEKALNAISHFRTNVETTEIEELQKRRDVLLSSKEDIEQQYLISQNQLEEYERRKVEAEEQQIKVIQEEERNAIRQQAALTLCKRLRYLLKYNAKKKQPLMGTSKKQGTKKKKKK